MMKTLLTDDGEGNTMIKRASLVTFWDPEQADHGLQPNTFKFASLYCCGTGSCLMICNNILMAFSPSKAKIQKNWHRTKN